jgi:hypothetical protein
MKNKVLYVCVFSFTMVFDVQSAQCVKPINDKTHLHEKGVGGGLVAGGGLCALAAARALGYHPFASPVILGGTGLAAMGVTAFSVNPEGSDAYFSANHLKKVRDYANSDDNWYFLNKLLGRAWGWQGAAVGVATAKGLQRIGVLNRESPVVVPAGFALGCFGGAALLWRRTAVINAKEGGQKMVRTYRSRNQTLWPEQVGTGAAILAGILNQACSEDPSRIGTSTFVTAGSAYVAGCFLNMTTNYKNNKSNDAVGARDQK